MAVLTAWRTASMRSPAMDPDLSTMNPTTRLLRLLSLASVMVMHEHGGVVLPPTQQGHVYESAGELPR